MSEVWIAALGAGVVGALVSTALLAWWASRWLLPALESQLEQRLEAAALAFGEQVATSVGAELSSTADSLAPRIRAEVRAGFADAMAGALRGELLAPTAKSAVMAGANVVGRGLEILLGRPAPTPPDPDDEES